VPVDLHASLNPEQFAAATAPDGPALVLAAAGTGKTRTLVHRVAHLVANGVPADRILLLTFTNRAAQEMLERARALVQDGVGGIWGGTFHHMANRLLRRHAPLLGYRADYTILDRDDSESLIAEAVKDRKLGGKEFPRKSVLMSLFSSSANSECPLSRILERRYADFSADPGDILKVHGDYAARKKKLDAMDFDYLLVQCVKLLEEHKDVRERYQERFLHVLVDEYQDTNTLQARIVDRLAGRHGNIMVVGDDFQSIYGWRGADYRNILSFPRRYAGARQYKLETNYRSTPQILAVANACIAGNPLQFQKTLRATRGASRKPRVFQIRDGEAQARLVVEEIRNLRRNGYKQKEIAILYRAHFHAMELQIALTQERIAFTITSGVRFFEQAHIKDVCSMLRILVSPEDELAFTRLLGMFPGVGPKTAQALWKKLGEQFDASSQASRDLVLQGLRPGSKDAWNRVTELMKAYAEEGLQDDPGEVIHRFLETFYSEHAANTFEDDDRRVEEIRELILYTAKYESAEQFLSDVALLTNLDAESEQMGGAESERLRLSTVHQAKGLEWPVVILLWVTEGMFPSARTLAEAEGNEGEAEERRLFYVAVTRAKDELLMCAPEIRRMRDGGVMPCAPSRFLAELPPGLVSNVRPAFI
jgi:DNA helicase-2/ATP-dependent DNA helicase PcrA